jgi:hypothetical protein
MGEVLNFTRVSLQSWSFPLQHILLLSQVQIGSADCSELHLFAVAAAGIIMSFAILTEEEPFLLERERSSTHPPTHTWYLSFQHDFSKMFYFLLFHQSAPINM